MQEQLDSIPDHMLKPNKTWDPMMTGQDFIDDFYAALSTSLFIMYICILVVTQHDREK